MNVITCPVCKWEYSHLQNIEEEGEENSYDHSRPSICRGEIKKIKYDGECGHTFYLCIGFHKGINIVWSEDGLGKGYEPCIERSEDNFSGFVEEYMKGHKTYDQLEGESKNKPRIGVYI